MTDPLTFVRDAEPAAGAGLDPGEFDGPAWRTMFIFDPRTCELIATRSIGKKELPGRDIRDWALQLDARGTDSAPAARDFDETRRKRRAGRRRVDPRRGPTRVDHRRQLREPQRARGDRVRAA
jgi:hypothetical protein